MLSTEYDFVFKILIIGDSAVGKSSLLLRFADDVYHDTFQPTIGVDFKIRTIEQDGSIVKLQMWDTAGQEKFKTITSAYYKGAQGIIVMFDLTDRNSFDNVKNWISESYKYNNCDAIRILVGNKCDLSNHRTVTRQQAEMFANNENMKYYESSAKMSQNVQTIFNSLSSTLMKKTTKLFDEKNRKEGVNKKPKVYLQPIKPNPSKPIRTTCC